MLKNIFSIRLKYIVFLALFFLIQACATANRGLVDYFRIDTVPQGASVELKFSNNKKNVTCEATPCAIKLSRRANFIATIRKDGFEDVEIFITHSHKRIGVASSVAQNVASGAAIGAISGVATAATVNAISFGALNLSTTSAASVAAGPAAIVAGGLIATDIATGANQHLIPNPVVIGLVPKGEEKIIDERVELFNYINLTSSQVRKDCKNDRNFRRNEKPKLKKCIVAVNNRKAAKRAMLQSNQALFARDKKANQDAEVLDQDKFKIKE